MESSWRRRGREHDGQVSRDASEGAKIVSGVVAERLAETVAEESSWKPSVERIVAKRAGG